MAALVQTASCIKARLTFQTSYNSPSSRVLMPYPGAKPLSVACKSAIGVSVVSSSAGALRPSPAEEARTLIDLCNEGTLCMCGQPNGWPFGTCVKFALEPGEGLPVFHIQPSVLHAQYLMADPRCSLHIQMEQPGHRKPQCTFKGKIVKAMETSLKERLKMAWKRRFEEEIKDVDYLCFMVIDSVLQSLDLGEENVWVTSHDYKQAVADPLRECAGKIVEDMNRNHWEDVHRFCKVYAHLAVMVQEARITWVDRLGFDMRILTISHDIMEVRIPFSREVVDERDARSSLTMMAQIAWEYERNYCPPEIQIVQSLR